MSIEEIAKAAGRVIIAGFEGTSLPSDLVKDCKSGELGGLILFKRNVESSSQVSALLHEVRKGAPAGERPITCLDQEGGRVVRMGDPLTVLPPAREFGQLDDTRVTAMAGRLVGLELRAIGFSLNFAPVMDVDTNPQSPVIGDRSFGSTPSKVISHGLAFARGHKDAGVFPCAKHFPGHGDADVDSHRGLPTVNHGVERITQIEMEPFTAWARTGLGPIMSAHILFPALDTENPATASFEILTHILKEKLHFSGVVLTDDLEMGAIGALGGAPNLAVKIIRAGADGLLVCRSSEIRQKVKEQLVKEALAHPDFLMKLQKAGSRLNTLAYPSGPTVDFSWLGSDEHRKMQEALGIQLPSGQ